jgi:hypothetical protein
MTSPVGTANAELVEAGDIDELLRHVDRLSAAGDWDALVDLRDRCRQALERGKQLWPVASHAEYRLALEAPGPYAGAVLVPGAGRFALGPLPEVAASTHTWGELAPHAPPGPPATLAAHERVLRGEDLTADPRVDPAVLEVPLVLAPWEPAYPLATYRAHDAEFGDVPAPPMEPVTLPSAPAADPDPADAEICRALAALADTWVTASNGTVATAAARGGPLEAIATLGHRAVRAAEVDAAHALALMAWAAGSGGAHGRRPGMAAGRFGAWWAAGALTGLTDPWPPEPGRLGDALARLRWVRFDLLVPTGGWVLRLAVADPATGRAWAVDACDRRE